MKVVLYQSGDEVRRGDRIRYHGEPGEVEFVVTELTGDPQMDWYVREFSGGGIMIKASGFGNVFLPEADEHLELVSRGAHVAD
jgi:hypothetical protein